MTTSEDTMGHHPEAPMSRSGWLKCTNQRRTWSRLTSAGMYWIEYRPRDPAGTPAGWYLSGPDCYGLIMAYVVSVAKQEADLFIFDRHQFWSRRHAAASGSYTEL